MNDASWLSPATVFALVAAGLFFLCGLLTGVWKYRWMIGSEQAEAPYYVNIAHRTSLMYSFACLLLGTFAQFSAWPERVNLAGVAVPALFFAGAVTSYVIHGLLRDTDNQLRRPHRLGSFRVPTGLIRLAMAGVILGETGGFLVLFTGFVAALLAGMPAGPS
ncbi:MAG: hypothetical protein P8080_11755 [Gammaproteobacteria bacterium]